MIFKGLCPDWGTFNMEMTFRWFGTGHDTVTLKQIRQIPGVKGVITTLYDKMPGELWTQEEIHALRMEVEAAGLKISGIESVNIHDDIKIGGGDRDLYIDNYIKTLENLGKEGIHMVCYNFMPVFDWTRTELARVRADGSQPGITVPFISLLIDSNIFSVSIASTAAFV